VIFSRALDAVALKAQIFDSLSDAYVQAGDDVKAIEAASRGVAADPSYWENHLNLAAIYARRKEIANARDWFLKALQGSNNAERVLASYAAFLAENKVSEEAMLRYQQLTGLFPDNATYHTLLGNLYLTADLSDCALSEYLIADKKTGSKEAWILGNIGNLYNNKGFHTIAIDYLKKALSVDPESQYAHERLASAMKKRDDERKKLEATIVDARKSLTQPAVVKKENEPSM
jgi:Tfp pilus assembly protein PilF